MLPTDGLKPQSTAQLADTDGWFVFFGALGLAQGKQIFHIIQVFPQAVEFLDGQDCEFGLAVAGQKFGMELDHVAVSLTVSVTSVQDTVNDDTAFEDLEEDAIVSHPQAVFGREIGQALDVASEAILEQFDFLENARLVRLRQIGQILLGAGLEFQTHHFTNPRSTSR
jgi:hypothetical protein